MEKSSSRSSRGIPTIHERPLKIPPEVREKLAFDWHLRASFVSHFTDSVSEEEFFRESFRELSDFADQPYTVSVSDGSVILVRRGEFTETAATVPSYQSGSLSGKTPSTLRRSLRPITEGSSSTSLNSTFTL